MLIDKLEGGRAQMQCRRAQSDTGLNVPPSERDSSSEFMGEVRAENIPLQRREDGRRSADNEGDPVVNQPHICIVNVALKVDGLENAEAVGAIQ